MRLDVIGITVAREPSVSPELEHIEDALYSDASSIPCGPELRSGDAES